MSSIKVKCLKYVDNRQSFKSRFPFRKRKKKISRNNFKLTIQKLETNVINTLYFGGLTLNQTFISFIYILNGKKIRVKCTYFL